jgi:hypothetical protein
MGAIEELQRDCVYCRQPITLKWPMPSEGVCLVFHDKCWDKFWADYNAKLAIVSADVALEPRRSLGGPVSGSGVQRSVRALPITRSA